MSGTTAASSCRRLSWAGHSSEAGCSEESPVDMVFLNDPWANRETSHPPSSPARGFVVPPEQISALPALGGARPLIHDYCAGLEKRVANQDGSGTYISALEGLVTVQSNTIAALTARLDELCIKSSTCAAKSCCDPAPLLSDVPSRLDSLEART